MSVPPPSLQVVYFGQLEAAQVPPVKTIPDEAEAKLNTPGPDGTLLLNGRFISTIFREFENISAFAAPEQATFDITSNDALCAALSTAMAMQQISFKDVGRPTRKHAVAELNVAQVMANVLRDSFTLRVLDLTNSRIDGNDAKLLAKAIPGNKTVQDWLLAENPIGDEAGTYLAASLSRTAAQRVSLRRCEFTSKSISSIAETIMTKTTTLFALDLRENPGYNGDVVLQMQAKQDILQKNAQMMFPRSQCTLSQFNEKSADGENGAEEGAAADGGDEQGHAGADGEGGGGTEENDGGKSRSRARSGYPPPPSEPSMSREEFERSLRRWKRKDPVFTGGRRYSPAPATSTPQGRAMSPTVQSKISMQDAPEKEGDMTKTRDILHNVDHWKDVRNQYNQYISSPARSASAAAAHAEIKRRAEAKPTFVLGKRVTEIERRGNSPAFRGKPIAFRTATPKDIERNAPWLHQPQHSPGSQAGGNPNFVPPAVGTRTTVHVGYTSKGDPLYTTIEDGGETTYLNDDPRCVGYFAEKVKKKEIAPKEPWRRSNTQRDVRFAPDERSRSYVLKDAQAPDPGMYTVEDEWEKNARKLRERSKIRNVTALGRPLFGMSGAPRGSIGPAPTHHADNPGPGSYEIP